MAIESKVQSSIIKYLQQNGAIVVNGSYTKIGISDLICGIPRDGLVLFTAIEVKDPSSLAYILRCAEIELSAQKSVSFRWDTSKKYNSHVLNQLLYLNKVRDLGADSYLVSSVQDIKTLGIIKE